MQVIEWPQFLENGPRQGERLSSLTVGVFDGVHRGHQALIKRVVSHDNHYVPTVITFRQNHKKVHTGGRNYPGDIQTLRQKIAVFSQLGLEITLVVEFTESFRRMSGAEFLRILHEHGNMGFIAVGSDFRCGYRLDTDARAIQQFYASRSIPADIVEGIMEGSRPVSSSRIRAAITGGKLKEAAHMLGFPFTLDLGGAVDYSGGRQVYRVAELGRILPPPGRYPVLFRKTPEDSGTAAEIIVDKGTVRVPEPLAVQCWEFAEFVQY